MGLEIYKTEIIKVVVTEFVRRKLHIKYHREIEEWKKYMREQKFAIKLDKHMRNEIKRFKEEIGKWTIPELEKFVIEGLGF